MKQLVLTIIGKDRVGLVDNLSSIISEHHGNWLASNLSNLCGLFAGIVQVEVEEEYLANLSDALHNYPDLEVKIQTSEDATVVEQTHTLNLVITGNDRKGIVQEISSIIRHKGASIVHFTSKQQSAPNWGVPLFNAVATIELTTGMNSDDVIDALESFASDLIIDIEPAA